MSEIKDYLTSENERNKAHAALYEQMLRHAFREQANCAVLIGHHLTFEFGGLIDTENEIPSADTLMFDHDIMGRLFGERATLVMMSLARVPVEARDDVSRVHLEAIGVIAEIRSSETAQATGS